MRDETRYIYDTVTCPDCQSPVTVRQPRDHSEHTPAGKCKNCGSFLLAPATDHVISMGKVEGACHDD